MKAVSIKLPDALKVRLEAEATRRGISLGAMIREAAESYVATSPAQKKLSAYDLSKDLCGALEGGPGDLSTNPKYLEDLGLDSMGDDRYRSPRRIPGKRRRRSSVGN